MSDTDPEGSNQCWKITTNETHIPKTWYYHSDRVARLEMDDPSKTVELAECDHDRNI